MADGLSDDDFFLQPSATKKDPRRPIDREEAVADLADELEYFGVSLVSDARRHDLVECRSTLKDLQALVEDLERELAP